MDDHKEKQPDNPELDILPDENTHLFIYGNLKIVEKETGEVLINKRF